MLPPIFTIVQSMAGGYLSISRRISFKTVCAETMRLAASGMTIERGLSITSSVTIMFLRTGRQCMNQALSVRAILALSTVQLRSVDSTLP